MKYDPFHNPDPGSWLEPDESERIRLAENYHRHKKIRMPNLKAHSTIDAMVENQVAMGDAHPARRVLERLMQEGLDRHEAVHAIGSVVAAQLHAAMKGDITVDAGGDYDRKLERLTAKSWKKSFENA
jgi:hypothetical protein